MVGGWLCCEAAVGEGFLCFLPECSVWAGVWMVGGWLDCEAAVGEELLLRHDNRGMINLTRTDRSLEHVSM